MTYFNDSSGLTGLFAQLTQQLDQRAQNEANLRAAVKVGAAAPGTAPAQSFFSKLINGVDPNSPDAPAAPQAPGAAPMQLAGAMPAPNAPQAPMPTPVAPVAASPLSPPPVAVRAAPTPPQAAASAVPSLGTPGLPAMAAIQGQSGNSGIGGLFSGVEQKFNLPAGYLAQTAHIESGGDPNAVSSTGAKGLFQFTKGTAAQYGLSNPNDVVASTYAAGKLAADNAASLQQALGRPPSAAELYLAHQQGAGGASALLSNPNARAGDIVGDKAVRVNGGDPNMSAGQFAALWTSKFGAPGNVGGAPIGAGAPTMMAGALGGGVGGSPAPLRAAAGGSPYGALNPGAFASQGGAMPTFAASGAGGQLSPATQFANLPNPGASATTRTASIRSGALGFASSPVAAAPASQAIAAAQTGDDETDDGVSAPAAPVAAIAPLPTAPGVANAQSISAPLQQATNPGAQAQGSGITLPQIQALVANPGTREFGLKLWQAYLTPKAGYDLHPGEVHFDGNNRQVASVPSDDKTKADARPLTAAEKEAYGLPAGGSYELAGGKVMAVPGTYDPHSGGVPRGHVVGQYLVNDKGDVLFSAQGKGGTSGLDDDTREYLAQRVAAGDTTALVGLGRGAQGAANILSIEKRAGEIINGQIGQPPVTNAGTETIEHQADRAGTLASARRLGTLTANQDTFATEATGAIQLARQASAQVPRGQFLALNKARQFFNTQTNDPNQAVFAASNMAAANTYAKAINPTGQLTVEGQRHAMDLIETAQSPEAYAAVLDQMQREVDLAHNSARKTRANERAGTAATTGAPAAPAAPAPQGAPDGARQAPDGHFYAPDPARPGKYLRVDP